MSAIVELEVDSEETWNKTVPRSILLFPLQLPAYHCHLMGPCLTCGDHGKQAGYTKT